MESMLDEFKSLPKDMNIENKWKGKKLEMYESLDECTNYYGKVDITSKFRGR